VNVNFEPVLDCVARERAAAGTGEQRFAGPAVASVEVGAHLVAGRGADRSGSVFPSLAVAFDVGAGPGVDAGSGQAYQLAQGGADGYIVAEKLRSADAQGRAALARPGRYKPVAGNLSVKEVRVGEGARSQRFCVCRNPLATDKDATVCGNIVAYLEG
jgi:hypothetical protein